MLAIEFHFAASKLTASLEEVGLDWEKKQTSFRLSAETMDVFLFCIFDTKLQH